MASSVSSERAFSFAGITISKRRNWLKPDIVEALQFMKCLYRWELLFREEPSTTQEAEEDSDAEEKGSTVTQEGWDVVYDVEGSQSQSQDVDGDEGFVQTIA